MGRPAAKKGDKINATDSHMVVAPGPSLQLLPHKFEGTINDGLSSNVRINGQFAATIKSTGKNTPHYPQSPGSSFQNPPTDIGTIKIGSVTVRINGKGVARDGDLANTCDDPAEMPFGLVAAQCSVRIG